MRSSTRGALLAALALALVSPTAAQDGERPLPAEEAVKVLETWSRKIDAARAELDGLYLPPAVQGRMEEAFVAAGVPRGTTAFGYVDPWGNHVYLDWSVPRERFYDRHRDVLSVGASSVREGKLDFFPADRDRLAARIEVFDQVHERVRILLERRVSLAAERARALAESGVVWQELYEMPLLVKERERAKVRELERRQAEAEGRAERKATEIDEIATELRRVIAELRLFDDAGGKPSPRKYRIAKIEFDLVPWSEGRQRLFDVLDGIDVEMQSRVERGIRIQEEIATREKALAQAQAAVDEVGAKMKTKLTALRAAPPVPDGLAESYRSRGQTRRRIEDLEDEILAATEAGRQDEVTRKLANLEQLRKSAIENYEEIDAFEAALEARFGPLRKEVASLELDLRDRRRRRDTAQSNLREATARLQALEEEFQGKIQELDAAADALDEYVSAGTPNLVGVHAHADGRLVEYARRQPSLVPRFEKLEADLEKAEAEVLASRKLFHETQAEFERAFGQARAELATLEGAGGAILKTAYLQAGAEAGLFLLEAAEAGLEGGPLAAVADSAYKLFHLHYVASDDHAFRTADERKIFEEMFPPDSPPAGGASTTFSQQLVDSRIRTEIGERTVRDKVLDGIPRRILEALGGGSGGSDRLGAAGKALAREYDAIAARTARIAARRRLLTRVGSGVSTILGTGIDVLWGAAKEAARDAAKRKALEIEENAWRRYFAADALARYRYWVFHGARQNFWDSYDHWRGLLEVRRRLVEERARVDPDAEVTVETSEPFPAGSLLRVWVETEKGHEFDARVTVGAVEGAVLREQQGIGVVAVVRATGLNEADEGEVTLRVVPFRTR